MRVWIDEFLNINLPVWIYAHMMSVYTDEGLDIHMRVLIYR